MFGQEEMAVFYDELEEKLDTISQGLLDLEQHGFDQELVNEIFRAAHTIKGSSGIMGFERMATLTHEMENLFDLVRSQQLDVSPGLITILFECLDLLRQLQLELQSGEEITNVNHIIEKLQQFLNTTNDLPGSEAVDSPKELSLKQIQLIKDQELQGLRAFTIKVALEDNCAMKAIRAFIVFNTLEGLGTIIQTYPDRRDLTDDKIGSDVEIIFISSEDQETIKGLINTIPEVVGVEVDYLEIDECMVNGDNPIDTCTQVRIQDNGKKDAGQTVRVDVKKLDKLMNLVGELVIDRTRLFQISATLEAEFGLTDHVAAFGEISTHLARVTSELQEEIMKARMLPIAQVFNRFPRMVRDLAQKVNKEIKLHIDGKETELDRTVIEAINDPLLHLIRNAVDHGIETPDERRVRGKSSEGLLALRARHQENQIVIEVEDDGKGIDGEKIKQSVLQKGLLPEDVVNRMSPKEAVDLIFLPGFSTSQTVSDVSGRGVGMDVVRKKIEDVNGSVKVITEKGTGTKFVITLPLTLAIIQSLLLANGEEVYALPLANIVEIIRINRTDVQTVKNEEAVLLRNRLLPLIRLRHLFHQPLQKEIDQLYVVVVGLDGKQVGLVVDELLGEQEIVIKSLGNYLGKIPGFTGATILGDGKVALILDIRSLLQTVDGEKLH